MDGGYDDGYAAVPCLWGEQPGSLLEWAKENRVISGGRCLDLGCGEGKNALWLAKLGYEVLAIDLSKLAIDRAVDRFSDDNVEYRVENVTELSWKRPAEFDLVVMYGLMHCFSSEKEAQSVLAAALESLKLGGIIVIAAFNDRTQDLSAHPGFSPLLMNHEWYCRALSGLEILKCTDETLVETHPHNGIEHHHSLTRIVAEKVDPT